MDQPLPSCPEIEKSILAEFMASKTAWSKYGYLVMPEFFYTTLHRKMFEFMMETNITDMRLIAEKFPEQTCDVVSICESYFTASQLEPQIALLKDRYERRKVIEAAYKAMESARDFDVPAAEVVETALLGMASTVAYDSRPEHVRDITPRLLEDLSRGDGGAGLKSGLVDFDEVTGGLCPGEMVILAARPSMGKTTMALQIARHNSIEKKIPILIFSIETSKEVMAGRMLSSEANTSLDQAMRGNKEPIRRMYEHAGQLVDSEIYIDDTAAITMPQLESKTDSYVKNHGVKLVIVDHVGLVKAIGTKGRSRHEDLSEISKALKAVGKRHNIPMLLICQLSREVEKRKPPIPILSDLRESGSWEEDADKVVFLYREEYYNRKTDRKGICDVIIAKNKNGRTGHREVLAELNTMNFRNLVKDEQTARGWQDEY